MINLSLSEIVALYLVGLLLVVVVSWLRTRRRLRRARREEEKARVLCAACGGLFHDRTGAELPRCPHCGRPSERNRLPGV